MPAPPLLALLPVLGVVVVVEPLECGSSLVVGPASNLPCRPLTPVARPALSLCSVVDYHPADYPPTCAGENLQSWRNRRNPKSLSASRNLDSLSRPRICFSHALESGCFDNWKMNFFFPTSCCVGCCLRNARSRHVASASSHHVAAIVISTSISTLIARPCRPHLRRCSSPSGSRMLACPPPFDIGSLSLRRFVSRRTGAGLELPAAGAPLLQ